MKYKSAHRSTDFQLCFLIRSSFHWLDIISWHLSLLGIEMFSSTHALILLIAQYVATHNEKKRNIYETWDGMNRTFAQIRAIFLYSKKLLIWNISKMIWQFCEMTLKVISRKAELIQVWIRWKEHCATLNYFKAPLQLHGFHKTFTAIRIIIIWQLLKRN